MGQREQGSQRTEEALQINPHFHLVYANTAKQRLAALEAQAESKEARMPCSLRGLQFLSLLFCWPLSAGLGSSHGQFQREPLLQDHLESDRIRVRYFIDLAEIPTYPGTAAGEYSATAIDPNSTAVINYVAPEARNLGHAVSFSMWMANRFLFA
jgi:hypothetical protein